MRCEDGHDDAAYVLGALSAAERAAYERHLATCSFCREAVADLSRVPDMLDRLDADEFARLLDPSLAPAPTQRSFKPAFSVRVLSTVAAVLLVAVLGGGAALWLIDRPAAGVAAPFGPAVAMTAVDGSSPIAATIRLAGTSGGTKMEMACEYAQSEKPYTFRLIAYGPDDQNEQLGSWMAQPGAQFRMQGSTHFSVESLDRLELVRFDGKVMLTYRPR